MYSQPKAYFHFIYYDGQEILKLLKKHGGVYDDGKYHIDTDIK